MKCVHFILSFASLYFQLISYMVARPSGRSLAGILGSNPAGGIDVCL